GFRNLTACFLSESADPVVKGPGMNPMFLASLKISETAAPAFHDQLVLLVSWYSGIVIGHFLTPPQICSEVLAPDNGIYCIPE
ncbi:hypothetical protein, partial [Hungatella sp. SL.1.14]|uniref:hypothetical protein n=1 Tax=Hungatella sp. SL.1.14 TaxID=2963703 RepID=UPI0032E4BF73